jgi:CHAT domain-containing protein
LDASDDERVEAARALFRALLPAPARRTVAAADRLLISPDGVLWDLPFAVLVTNDQGKPGYLGLEKPIVYVQSLRTFAQGFQASSAARPVKPRVLVVGNPVYEQAVRRLQSRPVSAPGSPMRGERALLTQDSDLPESLPYAEEEAKSVATLYRAKAATGIEPSEVWFRRGAADADVIHLATHGYFNPFRAVSSGLLLAGPDADSPPGDTSRDGALQAWEVFVMQLRADLVVLSACQTGLGARVPGEGLIGLTRAFQVAGAGSIIATQWRVADRSTATAMVRLHQHLLKGMSKDEALRQAMRALASDPATAHPYYWAPFVLVGDYRPLRWLR